MTARRRLMPVLGVVIALVGCGVPRDGATRTVAADDVPYRLLDESVAPSDAPTVLGPDVTVPQVFLVDGEDRLVPRPQPIAAAGVEAVLATLLRRLRDGPTENQRQQGLGTAFGTDVGLALVEVADGSAFIEITPADQVPAADRLPLAVGQLVLTVTSVDGISRVVLLQDGQPVPAPLPGGELTAAPLTSGDYDELLSPDAVRPEKAVPLPTEEPD